MLFMLLSWNKVFQNDAFFHKGKGYASSSILIQLESSQSSRPGLNSNITQKKVNLKERKDDKKAWVENTKKIKSHLKESDSIQTESSSRISSQSSSLKGEQNENALAIESEKTKYYEIVREKLERAKFYPQKAKLLQQEGTVYIQFQIFPDGSIVQPQITKPSPFQSLNEASLLLLKTVRFFPPLPESLRSHAYILEVPIEYFL